MTTAQDLLRSEDCIVPGCPHEADRDGVCRHHPQFAVKPQLRSTGGRPKTWTSDKILGALRAWAEQHGRPPLVSDLVGDPTLPNKAGCAREFGSFNKALVAAGLTPRAPGAQASGRSAVVDLDETGSASTDVGEGDRPTVAPAPSPLPVQPPAEKNINLANLLWRLEWAAAGEWSVTVTPADAQLLLDTIGAA